VAVVVAYVVVMAVVVAVAWNMLVWPAGIVSVPRWISARGSATADVAPALLTFSAAHPDHRQPHKIILEYVFIYGRKDIARGLRLRQAWSGRAC
jgi:hypothetical protein